MGEKFRRMALVPIELFHIRGYDMKTNPEINKNLLQEVILKHKPELTDLIAKIGIEPLTNEQREDIRITVATELSATGLDDNDEPNARGLLLEAIIDQLGDF